MLSTQPETPAKLTFAWQVAAGPAIGRATTVTKLDDGRLHVLARSDAWRREIARGRPMLVERLRQLLGADAIRGLVIEGGDREDQARRGARRRRD